jgi:tetratricopeptide (TPR) repeat protein/CHAT domain-containing protein
MKKVLFLLLLLFAYSQNGYGQSGIYEELKVAYDQFRKEGKNDSSLTVAKKMNAWALQFETDSSLRYAVSLRYVGISFTSLSRNDSALYYWNKSLEVLEKQQRAESLDAASCQNNLGSFYFGKGDYKTAEPYYKKALEIRKKALGEEHPDYASSLNSLGLLYSGKGDYKTAEPYYKKVLEIRKKLLGEEHPNYASSLNDIGGLYRRMGDYKSAELYYQQALVIRKKALGEEHPSYATSLNNLAFLYEEMDDYKSAENYFGQVLEVRKKALGEEHPDYASSLYNLGLLYFGNGDYKTAEPYYKKALEIRKKVLGEEHPNYVSSLNDIGILYRKMGDYKSADLYYQQALVIRKKTVGEEHADYASSLGNLGVLHSDMGDYKVAATYYNQALEIRKKVLGEEHPDYAVSLNNLGNLYSKIGNYKAAEPNYMQALEIQKEALGEDHPEYASSLNNIGLFEREMGDYKAAERYFQQALEIRKEVFGEEHPEYASSLGNLGVLHSDMGDYKVAATYYKQALEIKMKAFGDEHPEYASSLGNLGIVYSEMGDYKAAEPYYRQTVEIIKKAFGEEHPGYASSLGNLGNLYSTMGDYKLAEPYYKQSLEIRKKVLGEEHPDYALSLNNFGHFYFDKNDFISAEPYFKQSAEIYKNALGEEHPDYLDALTSYAYVLQRINREPEAYAILQQNFSKLAKQTADNFEWLTDNQKEAYWKKESSFYEDLSEFANEVFQKVPEAVGLNFNASLLAKSKLLEVKILSNDQLSQEQKIDLESQELREELGYRRRLLAKVESDGSIEKEKLDKLKFEVDSLDKRLSLSWPEYAQQKKNLLITWDQVQQSLEEGEAAIEFERFKNKSDSLIYYNALVLKKGDSQPRLIQLCAERDLQAVNPEKGYSAYYGLVWQPMENALEGIKTIYYAPTGDLYNVPFHAIYAPKGTGDEIVPEKLNSKRVVIYPEYAKTEQDAAYLMDRYTLHQLTSTRYLALGLKQKATEPVGTNLAMVGAVNYDYLPESVTAPANNKKGEPQNLSSNYAYGKLDYLEGTKTEVDVINQQVSVANWQTTVLEGNDATEEKITKLEGKESREILHLATHGFAFPAYDFQDTTISQNSLKYSYRYSTNPMVRSGLILAGGNWAWTGSDSLTKVGAEQNGILTALEVSQLNLKKTKLVVLSACETGLGKIEGNEGTFGLKRGFKLAGVEQMIVSLWTIPDKETQELMSLFYSDLTQTKSPTLSFQKAQQAMKEKYPTSPFLWAGFVLVR